MTTDAELLRRAHDDPAAFRRLYERHAAALHTYHLRRTGDAEAAQDLTAETFAQAWIARRRRTDWSSRWRAMPNSQGAALPPDQREAIRLRVEEDLSYDDAARHADASPQVVRARVSRGLRSLRTRLDVTGGDR